MPIDLDILTLVKLLNKHGVRSFGSCVDVNTMAHHENGYGSTHCSICGHSDGKYHIARGFIHCIVTDMSKLTLLLDKWKWKHGHLVLAPNIELTRGMTRSRKHKWYASLTWSSLARTKVECTQLHIDMIAEMEQELS